MKLIDVAKLKSIGIACADSELETKPTMKLLRERYIEGFMACAEYMGNTVWNEAIEAAAEAACVKYYMEYATVDKDSILKLKLPSSNKQK